MFRRAGSGGLGDLTWPLSQGVSLIAGTTRTETRFYNGYTPTLLASTPGTGTTGTALYYYHLDPLGRFYVERVSTTSAVIGWRNAGAWTRQTITLPNDTVTVASVGSLDGKFLYFLTGTGVSEWSLNTTTRTATNIVNATFPAVASGFTTASGLQWISADTLLLSAFSPTTFVQGARLVRKVGGVWTSLDTFIEPNGTATNWLYGGYGPFFLRQESSTQSSLRLVENSLSGKVIIPSRAFPDYGYYVGRDRVYMYLWKVYGTAVTVLRTPWDGSGSVETFTISGLFGTTAPSLLGVHPIDGGVCAVYAGTYCRVLRCGPTGITAGTPATIVAPISNLVNGALGEPIA